MVKSCVAAGCAKTSNDGISFFKFPSDPVMRQQWTKEGQRTRDRWSGWSQCSVLCSSHFTADCFEPDSAIAATMGITKRQRLKPDAVPTIFQRQAPQHQGACWSMVRAYLGGSAATTTPETTRISGTAQVKKPRQAYAKRKISRVRNTSCKFMYTRQLGRECGRYFQPLLLNVPDDERADPLSMTSKAAFTTEEMGSEVERIDVGVQISPSKKQVQTRRVFFSWLH